MCLISSCFECLHPAQGTYFGNFETFRWWRQPVRTRSLWVDLWRLYPAFIPVSASNLLWWTLSASCSQSHELRWFSMPSLPRVLGLQKPWVKISILSLKLFCSGIFHYSSMQRIDFLVIDICPIYFSPWNVCLRPQCLLKPLCWF